jgi:hypothetical protein
MRFHLRRNLWSSNRIMIFFFIINIIFFIPQTWAKSMLIQWFGPCRLRNICKFSSGFRKNSSGLFLNLLRFISQFLHLYAIKPWLPTYPMVIFMNMHLIARSLCGNNNLQNTSSFLCQFYIVNNCDCRTSDCITSLSALRFLVLTSPSFQK